jgi:hypothetical protein
MPPWYFARCNCGGAWLNAGEVLRHRLVSTWSVSAVAAMAARSWRVGHAIFVVALTCLAGCSTVPRPQQDIGWKTVTIGLCEDYPEESRSLEKARSDLAAARDAGARLLRVSFGWDAMEPEQGIYDWTFWDDFVRLATQEYGLRLIPYVCYTPKWAAKDPGENFWRSPPRDPKDFGRFVAALVSRYRQAIHSWELWNEPDNPAYWLGSAAEFAALVRAGSAAVRKVDPTARVVLGGIATELKFLEALFRNERIAPFVDVVNLHSYLETWHPDPIERLPDYIEDAAEIVRTHGEREPLWFAEAGYSSVGNRARVSDVYQSKWRGEHTDLAQAAALARMLILALAAGESPVVAWYRINDLEPAQDVIGDDNNRHLGIRRSNGAPKPASPAFAQLTRLFNQPFRIAAIPAQVIVQHGSVPVVRAFELKDGRLVVVAWMSHGEERNAPEGEPVDDVRRAMLRLQLPRAARAMLVTDATGRVPATSRASVGDETLAQQLTLELRGGEVVFCVIE